MIVSYPVASGLSIYCSSCGSYLTSLISPSECHCPTCNLVFNPAAVYDEGDGSPHDDDFDSSFHDS